MLSNDLKLNFFDNFRLSWRVLGDINRSRCSHASVIQFVEECAIAGNCETVQEDDGKG